MQYIVRVPCNPPHGPIEGIHFVSGTLNVKQSSTLPGLTYLCSVISSIFPLVWISYGISAGLGRKMSKVTEVSKKGRKETRNVAS